MAHTEQALDVISSRLVVRVMESYGAFVEGMGKIQELGSDLQTTAVLCSTARKHLTLAQQDLAQGGLTVIQKNSKRKSLMGIVQALTDIKEIVTKENEIRERIDAGDFPEALSLFQEAKKLCELHSHYKCVEDLSKSLAETNTLLHERLTETCRVIFRGFSEGKYERIIRAFFFIDPSSAKAVADNFKTYILQLTDTLTRDAVFSHIFDAASDPLAVDTLQSAEFPVLCSKVTAHTVLPVVAQMLESLTDEIYAVYQILQWHADPDAMAKLLSMHAASDGENLKLFAQTVFAHLKTERIDMWDKIQERVAVFLNGAQNALVFMPQVEDYLRIVHSLNKFADIGIEFSGSTAPRLKNAISAQSQNYFANFHRSRVEELRAVLDNESWMRWSVETNFTVMNIQEIKTFVTKTHAQSWSQAAAGNASSSSGDVTSSVPSVTSLIPIASSSVPASRYLVSIERTGNPFRHLAQHAGFKTIAQSTADIDEEEEEEEEPVSAELKASFIQEDGAAQQTSGKSSAEEEGACLTASAHNVVKQIGRYCHMLEILPSISDKIMSGLSQTVSLYVYAVYSLFGSTKYGMVYQELELMSPQLKHILEKLRMLLPGKVLDFEKAQQAQHHREGLFGKDPGAGQTSEEGIRPLTLQTMLNLRATGNLYGLCERVAAAESLVFVLSGLNEVCEKVKTILQNKKTLMESLHHQISEAVPLLRNFIYRNMIAILMHAETHIPAIVNCKWNESAGKGNAYVGLLVTEFSNFSTRMRSTDIPPSVKTQLDILAVTHILDIVLEGFSRVKKCPQTGRSMMLLDLQMLEEAFKKLIRVRPIPRVDYVQQFIKGGYEPTEDAFFEWIRAHPEYSRKHVQGLAQSMFGASILTKAITGGQAGRGLVQKIDDIFEARGA
eukprot:TRINITY_DN931_c1_g1_i1.p1 TRINITY_DN931_c1_g1~~TRINITY_DN931_c1_g1_i1.p1  ORF type:complete len:1005 (+),score=270.38 TRINITY_DN931_c1_g1_i1:328-3015(+)